MSIGQVRKCYGRNVEAELRRLDENWPEFGVTRFWIETIDKENSDVLHLGAGPGKNTVELAK